MNNQTTLERSLLDRQAVRDCIARYCRAVDRHETDLLLQVFHADAHIEIGDFAGGPSEFADTQLRSLAERYAAHSHNITSHNCAIDGDIAHAESYVLVFALRKENAEIFSLGARYVDRLERRGGEWRIAHRRMVKDYGFTADGSESRQPAGGYPIGTRDRTDLSYKRPVELSPELRAKLDARYS